MASGTIVKDTPEGGTLGEDYGYSKLPDGTLIQWGLIRDASFDNGVCSVNINYRVPYVYSTFVPIISATVASASPIYSVTTAINSAYANANIHMQMPGAPTYTGSAVIMWTAIGRWK